MTKSEKDVIKKTYTCELPGNKGCGVIYHAMTTPELEVYEALNKDQQKLFDKKVLDNHIKNNCFRKQDYATSK